MLLTKNEKQAGKFFESYNRVELSTDCTDIFLRVGVQHGPFRGRGEDAFFPGNENWASTRPNKKVMGEIHRNEIGKTSRKNTSMRSKKHTFLVILMWLMRSSLTRTTAAFCRMSGLSTRLTNSLAVASRRTFGSNPMLASPPVFENERLAQSQDTIFALSSGFTGQQATAVAVMRISGPNAHKVLDSMTKAKLPPPRKAVLRKLYSSDDQSQMLDNALILLFAGPNSFTGEDLVEFHCHGSRAVVQGMLDELPKLGCRLAEPGEFTQRAFGNGKLDLVQVEALADILGADTQSQLKQALSQLDGNLSKVYEDWRSQLISGLAHAEAVIDFGDDERLGEDDILDDDSEQWNVWGNVENRMDELSKSMKMHLTDERKGEVSYQSIKFIMARRIFHS